MAIETGIQNSGLGLGLIFAFFDGLGGMAIVAGWWGIWHIVSGLSLAYFLKIEAFKISTPSITIKSYHHQPPNMKKYINSLIFSALLQFSTFSQPYTELGALKFQKYSSNQNEANEYSATVFFYLLKLKKIIIPFLELDTINFHSKFIESTNN